MTLADVGRRDEIKTVHEVIGWKNKAFAQISSIIVNPWRVFRTGIGLKLSGLCPLIHAHVTLELFPLGVRLMQKYHH